PRPGVPVGNVLRVGQVRLPGPDPDHLLPFELDDARANPNLVAAFLPDEVEPGGVLVGANPDLAETGGDRLAAPLPAAAVLGSQVPPDQVYRPVEHLAAGLALLLDPHSEEVDPHPEEVVRVGLLLAGWARDRARRDQHQQAPRSPP